MATNIWLVEGGNVNYVWLNPVVKKYKVVEETTKFYVVLVNNVKVYLDKSNLNTRIFHSSVSAKQFVKTMMQAEIENCEARIKRLKPKVQLEVMVEDVL